MTERTYQEPPIALPEPTAKLLEGIVLKAQSSNYFVKLPDQEALLQCTLRGKLKQEKLKTADLAAAGDRVQVTRIAEHSGVIEEILPRHSQLSRKQIRGRLTLEQVIAANIDQVLAVTSAEAPPFNPFVLDQFLVIAEAADLTTVICLNKMDLVTGEEEADVRFWLRFRQQAGYPVLFTSATEGTGLEELKEVLQDKTSVLFGQSGVGKSTLLNALQPGLKLRVKPVSARSGLGVHTTSTAELLPLQMGGYVCDTPGIRKLRFWGIEESELAYCFPEMDAYLDECRYPNCLHQTEPNCAVRDAVNEGNISASRYQSYLHMLQQL